MENIFITLVVLIGSGKIFIALMILIDLGVTTNAQISKEEYSKLTEKQKEIYDKQQKEIDDKKKSAKELRDMADKNDKVDRFFSDPFSKPEKNQGLVRKEAEKREKEAKEQQEKLDKAAREGIKNNEKKK
jgi:biopolymer transport protein ExbB/TolQ